MSNVQIQGPEIVAVRPYARLLTMLGEQLIKNDQIALVELMKNSYDADAKRVAVDFINFSTDLRSRLTSRLAITDDGEGMTEDVVRNHWLNPATPGKRDRKRINPRTPAGRIMQGEKGIGRFAIFKMGSCARIITRAENSPVEIVVEYDLSFLDGQVSRRTDGSELQGTTVDNEPENTGDPTFLDQVKVILTSRTPETFDGNSQAGLGSTHGTRIEVSNLRSDWTRVGIERAFQEAARLRPLVAKTQVSPEIVNSVESKFDVTFLRDGGEFGLMENLNRQLKTLFEDRAVLKVNGHFSEDEKEFVLDVNGSTSVLQLADPVLAGLKVYRDYFKDSTRSPTDIECGSFDFSFFIFDLSAQVPIAYHLDSDQKKMVKEHRIYLYRDGVRVLPYGDLEDDWLQLDVIRGTKGANKILGNDQTVGFIYITQEHNEKLQDKTNREGLLDSGNALGDFVALVQIILVHLRLTHFQQYQQKNVIEQLSSGYQKNVVGSEFDAVLENTSLPSSARSAVISLQKKYQSERDFLETRATRTEDLAGVGLSVEAASHDIIATANQSLRFARSVQESVASLECADEDVRSQAAALVESLSFVTSRLQDIQGLFVSTRQSRRLVTFRDYLDRVIKIYSGLLRKGDVDVEVKVIGDALRVKATDAALLQVLINLFDNATYWLSAARTRHPQILVTLNNETQEVIFSDNGPGVPHVDTPYIFEAFYSGKGETGKGLGLYIARQVGLRSGFRVDLVTDSDKKILSGANFLISFSAEEENE